MWTKGNDGTVFWSDPAKMLLVGLLKQNPYAISNDRLCPQKPAAWKKIYDELIKAGMPKSSNIERVKKCWYRLNSNAKAQHAEQMKKHQGKKIPISKLNQAIINLLNNVNSPTIQEMMPKVVCFSNSIIPRLFPSLHNSKLMKIYVAQPKVMIKQEPESHDENNEPEVKRIRLSRMNPVVKLDRLVLNNDICPKPIESGTIFPKPTESGTSAEYWDLMKKVVEHELKLKLAQRENEEERMEIERELHQKNMILVNLKIKVQQMQIEALQSQTQSQFD